MPSRPGEFHPEPLTDSGREPLDSSGSCHRAKAAAFHCSSGLYEDAIVKGVFCWCLAILIALGYGYRRAVNPAAAYIRNIMEEIANVFLLKHSYVSLSYSFVPIQGEPFACVRHSPHQLISGRVKPVP